MDLIDRQSAIEIASGYCHPANIADELRKLPSAQPDADFVTVVRCKDCKHNQCKSTSGNALCELFYGMTDQMGFCHCGERRNGWED